jgi:hypothetical protein
MFVDAVLWDGDASTANQFLGDRYGNDWQYTSDGYGIEVPTPIGMMAGEIGTWIVKRADGVYLYDEGTFMETYEDAGE